MNARRAGGASSAGTQTRDGARNFLDFNGLTVCIPRAVGVRHACGGTNSIALTVTRGLLISFGPLGFLRSFNARYNDSPLWQTMLDDLEASSKTQP